MNINIGTKYLMNGKAVEALAYNKEKEVLLVKETDDNLMFVLGQFDVKDSNIISTNRVSYTITETEMLNCVESYDVYNNATKEMVVKAIRKTYYQIPTYLAEVVAEWYMRQ